MPTLFCAAPLTVTDTMPTTTGPLLLPTNQPSVPPAAALPPPRIIDNPSAYTMDVCHRGQGYQYPVDWEGYGLENLNWVPRWLILNPCLV
eukprot:superscaffoldBa00000581_g5794